ncbi:MAG: hypothetical protein PHX08_06945 [Lachnospiraceae bacterium]|nr:hypothetical protein [Lachnospiraceae bacterium]
MDYVTNEEIITKDQKPDHAATVLAYDMAMAKFKKERKEKKKHA